MKGVQQQHTATTSNIQQQQQHKLQYQESHHRDPPPYPGHTTHNYYTPGYRQSFSGSEASTDLSLSSCENLSTSLRQDPQGEETASIVPIDPTDIDGNYSILPRLGLELGGGVEVKAANSSTFYVTGSMQQQQQQQQQQRDGSYNNSSHVNTSSVQYHQAQMRALYENMVTTFGGTPTHTLTQALPQYVAANTSQQQIYAGYQQAAQMGNTQMYSIADMGPYKQKQTLELLPVNSQQSGNSPSGSPQAHYTQNPLAQALLQQQYEEIIQERQKLNQTKRQLAEQEKLYQQQLSNQQQQQLKGQAQQLQGQQQQLQNQQQQLQNQLQQSQRLQQGQQLQQSQQLQQGQQSSNSSPSQSVHYENLPSQRALSQTPTPGVVSESVDRQSPWQHYTPKGDVSNIRAREARSMTPNPAPSQTYVVNQLPSRPKSASSQGKDYEEKSKLSLFQGHPEHQSSRSVPASTYNTKSTPPQRPKLPLTETKSDFYTKSSPEETTGVKLRPQRPRTAPAQRTQQAPPPAYATGSSPLSDESDSGGKKSFSCQVTERPQLTRSQPDLTLLPTHDRRGSCGKDVNIQQQQQQSQHVTQETAQSPAAARKKVGELDHAAIATRATQMVERLSEENRSLRQELEGYIKKVCKLQKFEMEIQKVSDDYDSLCQHSRKRESLDKVMRYKLESEMKKLRDTNKELKEQLEQTLTQMQQKESYNMTDHELRQEILRKDSIIAKLIAQNRDLAAVKDKLELDSTSLRTTLQEQKTHIEVLDSALSNAQATVVKAEDEIAKRQAQEEKVNELQRLLSQLQLATEKRQDVELRLRSKLEEELRTLRNQKLGPHGGHRTSDTDEGISSDSESPTSIQSLIRQMQNKEQRILQLESEVAKWEQKFIEETAFRQLAVDAASYPKDARIAALESNSAETEKIIAEARNERLRHLDEVYKANRTVAELESRYANVVHSLQAQLAEKEAMIKVLQRHTASLSRTSSMSSLFGSPTHSPHPSVMSPPSSVTSSVTSHANAYSIRDSTRSDIMVTPVHSKSNSTGTSSGISTISNTSSKDVQFSDLQKLQAQAAIFGLQAGSEQLKKCLWQV